MSDSYSQRGGLTVGEGLIVSWLEPWPLASLTATRNGIMLRVLWSRYYFDKVEISAIREYNGPFWFLSRGVQILHENSEYPPFIVFWSFRRKSLVSRLERLGFVIQGKTSWIND